jgi:AMP-binding enzyme
MPSLFELIRSNYDNYPTADALGRPDGPFLDHVSLHRIVVTMGETLRSIGIERGDRIALSLPDALHAAVAFLAVATHAVCAPMNPRYRRAEIEFHLTDLGISALVVPEDEDSPALDVAARLGVWILRLACDERGRPVAAQSTGRCWRQSSSPASGPGFRGTRGHSAATEPPTVLVASMAVKRCLGSPSSPIARILDQPGLCPLRCDAESQRDLPGDNSEGLRAVIDRNSPAGRPGQWLHRPAIATIK